MKRKESPIDPQKTTQISAGELYKLARVDLGQFHEYRFSRVAMK